MMKVLPAEACAMTRVVLSLICAAAALCLGERATATLMFVSDSTWRVTADAPQAGWNTDLTFDDSEGNGWQAAQGVPDAGSFGFPNAIWFNSNLTGAPLEAWFRKEFTVDELQPAVAMTFTVDDDALVYLNGQLILADTDGVANAHVVIDLTPFLHVGENLIAVEATDGPLGVNRFIEAQVRVVPEPATAALVAIGLGLTALSRRSELRRPTSRPR
jgi:hypothetical protein